MLFSRANLAVRTVVGKGKDLKRGIHFAEDGSTVATNGRMLLVVGPVDEERVHYPDVGKTAEPGAGGVTVEVGIVDQAAKNIPRDKRISLQHVAMTERSKTKVKFTTVDPVKEQHVSGRPMDGTFPNWAKSIQDARSSDLVGRVCLNRRDLVEMLKAIEVACSDKGDEHPVYIEFRGESDQVVLRSINYATGQMAVGLIASKTKEKWLQSNPWERKTFARSAKRKRIV